MFRNGMICAVVAMFLAVAAIGFVAAKIVGGIALGLIINGPIIAQGGNVVPIEIAASAYARMILIAAFLAAIMSVVFIAAAIRRRLPTRR